MNKILFAFSLLLTLNTAITASWQYVSQDPQDYLEGHYVYNRYAKKNKVLHDQTIIYPLPRQEISELENTLPYHTFWACNAGNLQSYHFPEKSRDCLALCWASQLNAKLQEEFKKAQERDIRFAKQYVKDLQTFQFIKREINWNLPYHRSIDDVPDLNQRPKASPFGPIGPSSLRSPTDVTDPRFNRSYSQDKNY